MTPLKMPTKTAIVTGACSGMGLALTHHLLSSPTTHWRVVLADINETLYHQISPTLDPIRTKFQLTDVSSWEDNAALFKTAFEWSSSNEDGSSKGRIDFLAANAGITDTEVVYEPFDLDAEPVKPDLKTIEVDLLASFYGLKLFIHYARKTRQHLSPAESTDFTPGMIITASTAGLYPFSSSPQYCAAKHGLIGLTRSVGPRLLAEDGLSVNAILPGLVATGLLPPWMITQCPPTYLTPMSTVLEAYDDLMREEVVVEVEGGERSRRRKTGLCLEVVQDKLFYREPVEYSCEALRWLMDEKLDGGFMMKGPQGEES